MTSRSTQVLPAALVLAAAFASVGCDSETATSGTAALSVRIVPSPAGAGRFAGGPNDFATLEIQKISFEPTDPALLPLLGGEALTMRFGQFTANLAATEGEEYAAIALPPGSYVINEFAFRAPRLQDSEATPAAPVCIDRIAAIPSGPASVQVPPEGYTLDASELGLTFTIAPGQTHLDIVIDVPGLIAAYQATFTCADSCGGGAACLTAFDSDAFRAAFPAHVSIP